MASEMETIEQRLKSFMGQLQTECGILERLVYKHKNQHRRCSYFQYILKVCSPVNAYVYMDACVCIGIECVGVKYCLSFWWIGEKGFEASEISKLGGYIGFLFPCYQWEQAKTKVQLLESLKRRRCGAGKYNFLERLLGVTRLLSQTLLDAVLLYNTVSSLCQREQTVKLNQEGFEECKSEANNEEKDVPVDVPLSASKIQYENIEVLLGVDESGNAVAERGPADPINVKENGGNNDEKLTQKALDTAGDSSANIVSLEDVLTSSSVEMIFETNDKKSVEDGSSKSPLSYPVKIEKKKKVAFVSVKPPTPSTTNDSTFDLKGTGKNGVDKEDPFFDLLTGGSKKSRLV
ncbi:hypothetical protein DH2020_033314 [Rehmannia glutinosa]|uniref:Nucleolus and neural progenitor protein-like N-terminal domain-containing protein n=1 Tax=Rehmannia glutinosa TaxID=99300 RepID=A0ABR0VEV2_REHGL